MSIPTDPNPGAVFDPPIPGYGNPSPAVLPDPGPDPDGTPPADGTPPVDDTGPILGDQRRVLTLTSGTRIRLKPLKTRELLGIVRIAVGGLGGRIDKIRLNPDETLETFVARFAVLLISAMPYAEDETMAFLRMVCEPEGYVSVGALDRGSKAIRDRNRALEAQLDAELDNPDFDDTITIMENLAAENGGDLQSWGKRLAGIIEMALRTGLIPASPTSTA